MASRLVLHIGVQKSGTTYLQQLMQERVDELATAGVLYPVPQGRRRDLERVNHHEVATYGLLGQEYPWVSADKAAIERHWWEQLRKVVLEWPGTAIVSAEALSIVRSDAARRTVEAFGNPEATEVFITARSLGKLLPSMWQQHVRNGRARRLESFLKRLAQQREDGWDVIEDALDHQIWRAFGLGHLAQRWAAIVGTENVTVVTNPGSPADRLWYRFIEAADLGDMSHLPSPDSKTVHGGLTASEAHVLQSINANLLSVGWSHDDVRHQCNRIIQTFNSRTSRGPRLGIPPRMRERVETWNREELDELRASGVRIVGDLEDLSYSPESEPTQPTIRQVAEAGGAAARVLAAPA